jgi:hypothetical protein
MIIKGDRVRQIGSSDSFRLEVYKIVDRETMIVGARRSPALAVNIADYEADPPRNPRYMTRGRPSLRELLERILDAAVDIRGSLD